MRLSAGQIQYCSWHATLSDLDPIYVVCERETSFFLLSNSYAAFFATCSFSQLRLLCKVMLKGRVHKSLETSLAKISRTKGSQDLKTQSEPQFVQTLWRQKENRSYVMRKLCQKHEHVWIFPQCQNSLNSNKFISQIIFIGFNSSKTPDFNLIAMIKLFRPNLKYIKLQKVLWLIVTKGG